MISLADYRGKSPVLLGLYRGLYCPFCRRAIAQMAATSETLKSLGVDSLVIVASELENARLYFKYRPSKISVGADPDLTTHRSYRVPRPEVTPELMQSVEAIRINPTGELPEPLPIPAASAALSALDGYSPTPTDGRESSTFNQLTGQFLIDRDGIVRWAEIECAKDGLSGLGKHPSRAELLEAAGLVVANT